MPGRRGREAAGPVRQWTREIRMTTRQITTFLAALLLAVSVGVVGAGGTVAAGPTFERVTVDETFPDEFLTEECGVPVTTTVRGHVTLRTFADDGTGPLSVNTLNLGFTATAGDRVFRLRDVGADLTRVEPDGTAVLYIIGQVPIDFAGVLKIDLETGEAILEPRDRSEQQLARACRALAGG
jgi:hypothetical protein